MQQLRYMLRSHAWLWWLFSPVRVNPRSCGMLSLRPQHGRIHQPRALFILCFLCSHPDHSMAMAHFNVDPQLHIWPSPALTWPFTGFSLTSQSHAHSQSDAPHRFDSSLVFHIIEHCSHSCCSYKPTNYEHVAFSLLQAANVTLFPPYFLPNFSNVSNISIQITIFLSQTSMFSSHHPFQGCASCLLHVPT